jgi:Tol biopolymer transport system component
MTVMKKISFLLVLLALYTTARCQPQPGDTNYVTRITAIEWMPDGKSMLFSMVKYHKTNRQAPFFSKVFRYDLSSKKVEEMFENGSNLAPSRDGKTIAFMKRDDNRRADIYLYNLATKEQTMLKTDTTRKSSLSWSPDGKKLMYNISYGGINQYATLDICILDLASGGVKQVTHSGKDKSYNPVWCPDSKKIVYYLEKGDNHDQVWLTDADGSFHTNLTNDTSTHNFFPSWINEKTIIYTQSPETIMTMDADGTNKQKVEGIKSYLVKFSPPAGLLAYLAPAPESKVLVYDWKKKTSSILIDESVLNTIWK